MKVKVFKFKNGQQAYAVGNIEISLNKQEPVSVEEVEAPENIMETFFKQPHKYDHRGNPKKEKEPKKSKQS